MPDFLDGVSEFELQQQEWQVATQRQKALPETHPDFDGKNCVDCGEEIPAERLALCKVRCIVCQGLLEGRKKYFGGVK